VCRLQAVFALVARCARLACRAYWQISVHGEATYCQAVWTHYSKPTAT